MKKEIQKFIMLAAVLVLSSTAFKATAQIGNTGELLRAGLDDADILVTEYIRPYAEGFGAVNNTGWISSAGTHGVLGFDISLRVGAAVVPDSRNSYDMSEFEFNNLRLVNPDDSITPTISGENRSGPRVEVFQRVEQLDTDFPIYEFDMPTGLGFGYALAPMAQLSVGLPFDTDVLLRFVPETTFGDYGGISMFGLSIKHEINQWIPVYLPVDISFLGGFSQIGLTGNYTVAPRSNDYDQDPDNLDRPETWSGQRAVLGSSSWHINGIVGRTVGPLSVYTGIGMQGSTMKIDFEGTYPTVNLELDSQGQPVRILSSATDPLEVNVDPGSTFRTMVGASARFAFLRFSAEITYADYAVLNLGVGVGFR